MLERTSFYFSELTYPHFTVSLLPQAFKVPSSGRDSYLGVLVSIWALQMACPKAGDSVLSVWLEQFNIVHLKLYYPVHFLKCGSVISC